MAESDVYTDVALALEIAATGYTGSHQHMSEFGNVLNIVSLFHQVCQRLYATRLARGLDSLPAEVGGV